MNLMFSDCPRTSAGDPKILFYVLGLFLCVILLFMVTQLSSQRQFVRALHQLNSCFVALALVHPLDTLAGPRLPERIVRTGDSVPPGDKVQTVSGDSVSINNRGQAAVLVQSTGPSGAGQTVLAANFDSQGTITLTRATFSKSLSSRTYSGPWRLDSGLVGVRDQASGAPPASFVRIWDAGAITFLASTTRDGFDSVNTPSFSRNGSFFSFIGILGSSWLYLQAVGGAPVKVAPVTGGAFRPMTANNGMTVLRVNNGKDIVVHRLGGETHKVSPSWLRNPGASAGISDDGACIAFTAETNGLNGVFSEIDGKLYTIALPSVHESSVVDPFQTWRDQNGDQAIQPNEVLGGLSNIPSGLGRIAIKELNRPLGSQCLVTFTAVGANGVQAVYYARVDRPTGRVFGTARIAQTDNTIDDFKPTGFSLFDPLNVSGQIAFQASSPASSGAYRFQASTFTKYKQGLQTGIDVIAIAANPGTAWFNQPVNPNLPLASQQTMAKVGCALTSAAIIAGIFGKETTPREMRDLFLSLRGSPAIDDRNQTFLNRLELRVGNKVLRRAPLEIGNFNSIAAELRQQRPVMLCVPNKGSTGVELVNSASPGSLPKMTEVTTATGDFLANGRRHYILAYGLNPKLPEGSPATAADIYIVDPAYTVGYRQIYGKQYTVGEETIDVTLKDYFDIINASPTYSFDANNWFDEFLFVRKSDNAKVRVTAGDRVRQIQKFTITDAPARRLSLHDIQDVTESNPILEVQASGEVRVTVGGKTYASGVAVAQLGDILAPREDAELIAEFDTEQETGVGEELPDPARSFRLTLPKDALQQTVAIELLAKSTDVYRVSLITGTSAAKASNQLSGKATGGEIIRGTIEVHPSKCGDSVRLAIKQTDKDGIRLVADVVPGCLYLLQRSNELQLWEDAALPSKALNAQLEWALDVGANSQSFYRVSIIAPR